MLIVVKKRFGIMNFFVVSLFGHREIEDLRLLEDKLAPIIKELILTKSYVSFLIGRNGEFDECAASVIRRVRKEIRSDNNDINLILPYKVANIEYYEEYYDDIIIPEIVYGVHPKSAIGLRNQWMIEKSELIILYMERDKGGTYTAKKYAEKLNKKIINLCTSDYLDI